MPRSFLTFFPVGLAALLTLGACSPTFNWREVRPDNTGLSLLLPCKPDQARQTVPMAGRPTALSMLGCDAGGATFAVAVADIGDAGQAGAVLAQWQALTLDHMKADPQTTQVVAFAVPGLAGPQAVRVSAQGQRADGRAVSGEAAYFSRGSQLFQAVLYSDKPQTEVAETFFSSLKFQPIP